MKSNHLVRFGAIVALLSLSSFAKAEDWGQWRGPKRDGHIAGFTAPSVWPQKLTKQWSVNVGEGHSSPIIVGNRAYVFVRRGESEWTLCLNMANGKVIWEDNVAAPFDSVIFPAQRLGKAPRSTPLYHDGKLYTTGINGLITCFQANTGGILWRKDFSKAFSTPMPVCGAALSPLIDGKRIYVHVGHEDRGAFLALDKDTGLEIWKWTGEGPGYTSPVLATIGGTRQLITASHSMWISLYPENGQLLWSMKVRQNYFNHNSITPVVKGDVVYCGANQRPTFALRVSKTGGKWVPEKIWETRDVTMSTSSPVLTGNILYAVNEKRRGQVVCMAADSGKIVWECPGNKGENVTLYDAGSCVLAFASGGDMFVYAKKSDRLQEVARYEVADSQMWSSPAISGSNILVKGASTLTLWKTP
ncbi:MAG: PQQ-binding-like beta-propeller repeat protein [Armatimonadetes bacterium]|nr:PQQ-binding-like beta-propeller repeat protein [Armatimonadota bacterium]